MLLNQADAVNDQILADISCLCCFFILIEVSIKKNTKEGKSANTDHLRHLPDSVTFGDAQTGLKKLIPEHELKLLL